MSGLKRDPEEMLSERLAALAGSMADRQASPEVEARLLTAFRSKQTRYRRWAWLVVPVAAAACIALFAARWRTETPQPVPIAEEPAVREIAPPQPAPEPPPVQVAVEAPSRRVPPRPRTVAAAPPPEEIVTDFFRIRNGPLVDPDEMTSLIRVVVPSSTMRQFGLPVEFSADESRVQADVLLGQDGMARAIRFVR